MDINDPKKAEKWSGPKSIWAVTQLFLQSIGVAYVGSAQDG